MKENKGGAGVGLSLRQLMILLFLGQLSPGIQLAATSAAEGAGAAGWLAPLVALPALLLLGWLTARLSAEGGLARGLCRAFGARWGKTATLIYIMWGLVLLTVGLEQYGRRMTRMVPGGAGEWFFLLAMAGMLVWTARGGLTAFGRAGEIFWPVLLIALGAVLLGGLFQGDLLNVFPVGSAELAAVPAAALQTAALLAPVVCGGFLWSGGDTRGVRGIGRWAVALCLSLAAAWLVTLAGLGPGLTARAEIPLFLLARDMSVGGAIRRMEGLVVSLWMLSDLMLLGMLLFALCRGTQALTGRKGRLLPALFVAAALLLGVLIPPGSGFEAGWLTAVGLAPGLLIPAAANICMRIGQNRNRESTSCGKKAGKTKDIDAKNKSEKR